MEKCKMYENALFINIGSMDKLWENEWKVIENWNRVQFRVTKKKKKTA